MNTDWVAAFLIGLLGAGHCMGMCGGIASLMNLGKVSTKRQWLNPLFYNIGRLSSYALIGAIIGGSISTISSYSGINSPLNWLRLLSAVFMLLLALYIGQWWNGLIWIEKLGQSLWKHIAPFGQKLLPIKRPIYAIPFGFIWGWLPCGLVYSMLTWAAAAGNSINGALIMLAFGLGTLPLMLAVGVSATQFNQLVKSLLFRRLGAFILLAYALFQLYQGVVRLL
ncbi:sulfite exporter TauE/SafE family protein [Vibrio litoralis]|uniref:sulfite exporter TauE/SafE family protein n=1 Tax=Vibrio litoralis TaxID=335972 RepID=UPI00040F5843|nr:sulfite exporter TauE/SafE family protein [Vibrio litoralis]